MISIPIHITGAELSSQMVEKIIQGSIVRVKDEKAAAEVGSYTRGNFGINVVLKLKHAPDMPALRRLADDLCQALELELPGNIFRCSVMAGAEQVAHRCSTDTWEELVVPPEVDHVHLHRQYGSNRLVPTIRIESSGARFKVGPAIEMVLNGARRTVMPMVHLGSRYFISKDQVAPHASVR